MVQESVLEGQLFTVKFDFSVKRKYQLPFVVYMKNAFR